MAAPYFGGWRRRRWTPFLRNDTRDASALAPEDDTAVGTSGTATSAQAQATSATGAFTPAVGTSGTATSAQAQATSATGAFTPAVGTSGSSGLRRWLIQVYTDEQNARDAAKLKVKLGAPTKPNIGLRHELARPVALEQATHRVELRALVRRAEEFQRKLATLTDAAAYNSALLQEAAEILRPSNKVLREIALRKAKRLRDEDDEALLLLATLL